MNNLVIFFDVVQHFDLAKMHIFLLDHNLQLSLSLASHSPFPPTNKKLLKQGFIIALTELMNHNCFMFAECNLIL